MFPGSVWRTLTEDLGEILSAWNQGANQEQSVSYLDTTAVHNHLGVRPMSRYGLSFRDKEGQGGATCASCALWLRLWWGLGPEPGTCRPMVGWTAGILE